MSLINQIYRQVIGEEIPLEIQGNIEKFIICPKQIKNKSILNKDIKSFNIFYREYNESIKYSSFLLDKLI